MPKYFYTTAAAMLFSAAVSAQSAVSLALAATPHLSAFAAINNDLYTTAPSRLLEFNDDECLVVIYDLEGEKVYKTIVMDSKTDIPMAIVGSIHLVEVTSATTHQSFEIAVREDFDYAENF